MTIIVYRPYRPKRPPRRKAQAEALTVPTIVTAKSKPILRSQILPRCDAASDEPARSAIVTIRRKRGGGFTAVPDMMTPEERKRRSDAAAALWRELTREE
jgi:hypothetical protein